MAAYIAGYNNTADVAGFGFNAQSAMFYQSQHTQHDAHNGVVCDSCGANPLRGTRWRCQTCPDHDICGNCKSRGAGAGHRLQSVSVAQTNDALNGAPQGFQVPQDTGVHWTTCKGCQEYPIRGTLYTCMVCPGFDMCEECNIQRLNTQSHQHRFDFFYCQRTCNPAPLSQNAQPAQNYNGPMRYQGGSAEQQLAQNQALYEAEQKEMLHQILVEKEEQQGCYDNSIAAQQHGGWCGERKRDRVVAFMGLRYSRNE